MPYGDLTVIVFLLGFPRWLSDERICLPRQEMWAPSLGWEDPLEEEMTTHSQYSCLGNPLNRGAWWATVHGVTECQKMKQARWTSGQSLLRKGKSKGYLELIHFAV